MTQQQYDARTHSYLILAEVTHLLKILHESFNP